MSIKHSVEIWLVVKHSVKSTASWFVDIGKIMRRQLWKLTCSTESLLMPTVYHVHTMWYRLTSLRDDWHKHNFLQLCLVINFQKFIQMFTSTKGIKPFVFEFSQYYCRRRQNQWRMDNSRSTSSKPLIIVCSRWRLSFFLCLMYNSKPITTRATANTTAKTMTMIAQVARAIFLS